MKGTLARFGTAVIFGWALCTACTFGQVGIHFNGSAASPVILLPGDELDFQVMGPPGATFAALISPAPRFEVTNYGILLADPLVSDAWVFLDGFDQSSPTYGFASIPYDGNPFRQTFVPFGPGGGYAPSYWIQAIVADPLSPFGLTLTNAIELVYEPPPPTIKLIEPNFAAPLTLINVMGFNFDADPALDVVRLNGAPCQVLTATEVTLLVMLPADARSGPMTVETPHGLSPADPDSFTSWLAIAPAAFVLDTNVPAGAVGGPLSILGNLHAHDTRDYVVHLEADEELVAEMYVFDTTKNCISYQPGPLNPFLRVQRNVSLPITVLTDDNSGPGLNAAIGLASGSPHYVAPSAEDVIAQVDSRDGLSGGPYLLILRTRPATGLPVLVEGLFPADVRIGDTVTIMGAGFDPAHPDQHTVLMPGANATADLVTMGTVVFTVPPGARSGPVRVSAPSGTSDYNPDLIETWLCVHAFTELVEVESTTPTVPVGCAIHGTIAYGPDMDDYLVDLAAGQTLSLECHALSPTTGTITTSTILAPTPVDPEIQILATQGPPVAFAVDQNSGPGLSAGLGLYPANPPFTAPYAGTFSIRVSSFFAYSHGDYLLVINPGP